MGFDPVLSEYSDVLYDPRIGTHESCIREVENVDIIVLIVGSRFGGTALPEALSSVDIEALSKSSFNLAVLDDPSKLSVTQLEVLKAVELSIPVFAFVDEGVLHDRQVYLKNRELSDKLEYPSIEKKETAKFIFEFITFLNNRLVGNAVVSYSHVEDIENHLLKQWGALFQRLLREQREKVESQRQFVTLNEQLDDLKSALISTIETPDSKQAAKGVLRYRRLVDFLVGFEGFDPQDMVSSTSSFADLLIGAGVTKLANFVGPRRGIGRSALLLADGTDFWEMRFPLSYLNRLSMDWHSFVQLKSEDRQIILDAVVENSENRISILRRKNSSFAEYCAEFYSSSEDADVSSPIDVAEYFNSTGADGFPEKEG